MAIIGLGAVAMFLSMLLRKKQFPQVAIWKMILLTLWLTITGVLGTMILAYIELGEFGGTSFYGAVFLVPILILPAMLMRITYKDILNLCAPAECAMLLVMRFDCLDKGCCFGRYLPALEFQFPSQIAEMVVGYIKQFGATKIILGYPVNMNGSIGPRAENAAQIKEILAKYTDVPVILYDERCTTMIAHTILSASNVSSKKRKNVVDTLSAEIILQNYLDANR
jgi:putative Holliday junction resolvase